MNKMGLTESLIYMLLPQESNKSNTFHDILDNSEMIIAKQIDNKFKFTINALESERFELYNSGEQGKFQQRNDDNSVWDYVQMRQHLYLFLIAWENDSPLFATNINNFPIQDQMNTVYGQGQYSGNYYLYTSKQLKYIANSFEFTSNAADLPFDSSGFFTHSFKVLGGYLYKYHERNYTVNPYTLEYVVTNENDVTVDNSGISTTSFYTYPYWSGTYSDVSYIEVENKYAEMVKALYIVNNETYFDNFFLIPN